MLYADFLGAVAVEMSFFSAVLVLYGALLVAINRD